MGDAFKVAQEGVDVGCELDAPFIRVLQAVLEGTEQAGSARHG